MIREIARYLRQRFWPTRLAPRPVLDLVDFGHAESVVLDVGACCGGFAGNVLVIAPLSRVFSFEPNQAIQELLRMNAASFGMHHGRPRCEVIEAAAGESQGCLEFLVTGLPEASSLLPIAQSAIAGWPGADFSVTERQRVQVLRLDDFMDSRGIDVVKLLKLDVQGYELSALRGCSRRLRDIEYIICEVQFCRLYEGAPLWQEIVAYLDPFGFSPIVMDGFCFAPDGQPLQADILFKREN